MRRLLILAVAVVVVLLIAVQFALPPIIEGQVENRLTRDGGSARVDLDALPSPRLLFREGHSIRVRANGIAVPLLDPSAARLDDLDGFSEVDVRVTDMRMGPFRVSTATLDRPGDDRPYRATVHATITGGDLSAYAGSQLGGGLGGLIGGLGGSFLPGSDRPVPIELDAVLRSDGGRARAVTVHGSVAGLPAGPLVEALATALAGRF
jgi:hypothetical protein